MFPVFNVFLVRRTFIRKPKNKLKTLSSVNFYSLNPPYPNVNLFVRAAHLVCTLNLIGNQECMLNSFSNLVCLETMRAKCKLCKLFVRQNVLNKNYG